MAKEHTIIDGFNSLFSTNASCRAQFSSVYSGYLDPEDIPTSRCPAIMIGFDSYTSDIRRCSPAAEEIDANFVAFIVIKGIQPQELETRILDSLNAIRLARYANKNLSGACSSWRVSAARRGAIDAGGPVDILELTISVNYMIDPSTGN